MKTSFHQEKPSGTTSKHIRGLKTLQQLGNELWKNSQMWESSEAESVEYKSLIVFISDYIWFLNGTESA